MISATSASHRTESSKAFFSSPFLRFEKVTCLLAAFSMRFIWVFPLTISCSTLNSPNKKSEFPGKKTQKIKWWTLWKSEPKQNRQWIRFPKIETRLTKSRKGKKKTTTTAQKWKLEFVKQRWDLRKPRKRDWGNLRNPKKVPRKKEKP